MAVFFGSSCVPTLLSFMNHILLLSICQFLEQLTNVLFDYSGGKGTNPGGTRVSNYSVSCISRFGWNPSPPDGGSGPSWNPVPRHSRVSNLVRKFDKVFWGPQRHVCQLGDYAPGVRIHFSVSHGVEKGVILNHVSESSRVAD